MVWTFKTDAWEQNTKEDIELDGERKKRKRQRMMDVWSTQEHEEEETA